MSTSFTPYETNAVVGPSSRPRKTYYPQWPDSHDEAEYFEVPPDHFLAQQRGIPKAAAARPQPSSPTTATARRDPSISSLDSHASNQDIAASLEHALPELTSAIQAGVPLLPAPAATIAPASHQHVADSIPSLATFAEAHEEMPDTSTLAAADFDVDVRSGFLPPEAPVTRLAGRHEELWERALDRAKIIPLMQGGGGVRITTEQRLAARRWRRSIREMPVLALSEQLASDIRFARRGHLVLSFLAHFYIHSQPPPAPQAARPPSSWRSYFSRRTSQEEQDEQDVADELLGKYRRTIPASIAVPWVQLSQKLALPPVLTYATTVLWNWAYIDSSRGLALDNIRVLETFTGTKSEEHFYLTSALIEIRGVEALELMRASLDEAFVGDILSRRRISANLRRLAVVIADLMHLLQDVRKECDPKVFYWGIRPWFRGSNFAEGEEQAGWHFDGVDPPSVRRSFSGPSAGQSSMIHAIDVFLDVDHTRSKPRLCRPNPSPSCAENEGAALQENVRGADATFMERMQLYMPGHHRDFLTHLRSISFDDEEDRLDAQASVAEPVQEDEEGTEIEAQAVERPPPVLSHPIRSLAIKAQEDGRDEGLPDAYDHALEALKKLRDEHMKVAYLYIIAQARGSPPDEFAPLPEGFTGVSGVEDARKISKGKAIQVDDVLAVADGSDKGAKGTGGTDLVSFLKDCRVNTTDALISVGKSATKPIQAAASVASSAIDAAISKPPTEGDSGQGNSSASTTTPQGQSLDATSGLGLERLALGETDGRKADEVCTDSLPPAGLQVWAVNVAGWEPGTRRFSELVDKLLSDSHSAKDREKVQRYYHQIDRTRSLAARLLPRLMLTKQYGLKWGSARFGATAEGRPFLAEPVLAGSTDFNLTHDSDWVVMAFHAPPSDLTSLSSFDNAAMSCSTSKPDIAAAILGAAPISPSKLRVGVDVMTVLLPKFEKDVRSFCETMDMALTADEEKWVLSPITTTGGHQEALARLFDLWTHKEAFTKNVGKGLGFDFKTVELGFHLLAQDRTSRQSAPVAPVSAAIESIPRSVLKIKGVPATKYTFTEVTLAPPQDGEPHSQLVIAEGPFEQLAPGTRQISPPLSQEQAVRAGLLTVWKMEELVRLSLDQLEE